MDDTLRRALPLSPIALATMLSLISIQTVAVVPWLSPSAAEANHCTPPCDCVACVACVACDSCFACDAGCGCGYASDVPDECEP